MRSLAVAKVELWQRKISLLSGKDCGIQLRDLLNKTELKQHNYYLKTALNFISSEFITLPFLTQSFSF